MIVAYSTNCPKCRILKKKLETSGLDYEFIEDEAEVMKVAQEHNIMEAPFTIIDGEVFNFSQTLKKMQEMS